MKFLQEDASMERWKARQTSLFESRPSVLDLPESQRQKALLLLGSLLTEALAMEGECEVPKNLRGDGHDKDQR
jgi:hypothetical protein